MLVTYFTTHDHAANPYMGGRVWAKQAGKLFILRLIINEEVGLYTWLNLERKFSLAQEISFVSEFLPHRDISLAEEIVQLRHNKNKPGSGCFGSVVDRKTRVIYFWLPCC